MEAPSFRRRRKPPPSAALPAALQASCSAAQRPSLSRTQPTRLRLTRALRRAPQPWRWLPAPLKLHPQQRLHRTSSITQHGQAGHIHCQEMGGCRPTPCIGLEAGMHTCELELEGRIIPASTGASNAGASSLLNRQHRTILTARGRPVTGTATMAVGSIGACPASAAASWPRAAAA